MKLNKTFKSEVRFYIAKVSEDTTELDLFLTPTVSMTAFKVDDSSVVDNYAVLRLNYGTNVFKIQAADADSQPYVLTVVRGMPTPDFAVAAEVSGFGEVALTKALPIDNESRILYIGNEYSEGTIGKIYSTDNNVGSITPMGQWPGIEFTDIAPLPGSDKTYVVVGHDHYEVPILLVIREESDGFHEQGSYITNDYDSAYSGYDRIINVLPSNEHNEIMMLAVAPAGPYVERLRWNDTNLSFEKIISNENENAKLALATNSSRLSAYQMIKVNGQEVYAVAGETESNADVISSKGVLYKLTYTKANETVQVEDTYEMSNPDFNTGFHSVTASPNGNFVLLGTQGYPIYNLLAVQNQMVNSQWLIIQSIDGKTMQKIKDIVDPLEAQVNFFPFIQSVGNEGYVYGVTTISEVNFGGYVGKISNDFKPVWKKSYQKWDQLFFQSHLTALSTGQLIMTGETVSNAMEAGMGYIAKMGHDPLPVLPPSNSTSVTGITYLANGQPLVQKGSQYLLDVSTVTEGVYLNVNLQNWAASISKISDTVSVLTPKDNTLYVGPLALGDNEAKFRVSAEDDPAKTEDYNIIIHRRLPAEIIQVADTAKNINLVKTTFNQFDYSVDEQTKSLTLQLQLEQPAASISLDTAGTTVTGVTYNNLTKQITFSQLQKGKNTAAVVVKAPDNSILKYFISINKTVLSNNADLAGINSNIAGPAAKKPDGNYELVVSSQTNKLIIQPLLPSGAMIMQVIGGMPNADGSFTNEPELSFGINELIFTVRAENGSTKNTKLTIIRRAPLLQNITALINQAKDMNNDGKFTREDVLIILQWIPPVYVNPILTVH